MNIKKVLFASALLFSVLGYSQTIIEGYLLDKNTLNPINNVEITIVDSEKGTTSNKKGYFSISTTKSNFKLKFNHIAYESLFYDTKSHQNLQILNFYLNPLTENLHEIIISGTNTIVKERKTPIAATTLKKESILKKIGSKDLPEILTISPSTYATKNGGAYGDTSIHVRGFDQRNIAVLINNIPVNDMETGWVYWSNWLNLPEVTSAVQIQRGLGASKLAIPSIGGTINILTNSSKFKKGGEVSFQYGSENSYKKTISYHTGLLENGLSTSLMLGHFNGDGYVDETQAEVYSYFINIAYKNDNHRFMFTSIGAPQWHNQHNNASTLANYLKYSNNNEPNIKYNSEWGMLNNHTFTWSKNYFHKPIFSLNWDYQINTKTKLSSVFYGIFGKGGGTSAIGAINYNYPNSDLFKDDNGQVDFNAIYQWNSGQHIDRFGSDNIPNSQGTYVNGLNNGLTRYGFINNHSWYGSLINFKYKINSKLKIDIGFDGRYTSGKNALAVNNTLGADAYEDHFNINEPNNLIFPKDYLDSNPDWNVFKSIDELEKIVFYYQSKIKWSSLFSQLEYSSNDFSAFIQSGISNQQFQRIDYFNLPRDIDHDGIKEPQKSNWKSINGGNLKLGANYNLNQNHHIFLNTGFYSKQPLYNAIFNNYDNNLVSEKLQNERISSIEIGYGFNNAHYKIHLNGYYTSWKDRYSTVTNIINNETLTGRLYGIQEIHKGLELEASGKFNKLHINTMLSIGDWYYKGNINNVKLYNNVLALIKTKDFYLDNVKVGEAPQFTAAYQITYKVLKNLEFNIEQQFINNLYAKIDVANFSNPNHQGALKLPSYYTVNTGINYKIKTPRFATTTVNILVNNLFDKQYISKSNTNYFPEENENIWQGVNTKNSVFFGWGRTINLGIKFNF